MLRSGKRIDAILSQLREVGDAGRYYVEFCRGPTGEEWATEEWSDDEGALRRRIDADLRLGVYRRARLWYLDSKTDEWSVLESFPSRTENSK